MARKTKKPWLTVLDIDDLFIAVCNTNTGTPNTDDCEPPLRIDPFHALKRFIMTFAKPVARDSMIRHVGELYQGMQPKEGISDAD